MSAFRIGRLPPAGEYIGPGVLRRVLSDPDPQKTLTEGLQAILGRDKGITFHASGREAMRVALAHLAKERGRDEVVVPAYTCFSVAASAVAAGLRVRLVDVDLDGRIDLDSLARLPLERAAAVVVCNLFGNPEPIEAVRKLAHAAGAAVVDDAAQSLGGTTPEGPAGARGDVGILSFARGKPLSALGGGAIVWHSAPPPLDARHTPRRAAALVRALAYDAALAAPVFQLLAAVPALEIGRTVYDPGFAHGAMTGASLSLAAAQLPDVVVAGTRRAERAHALAARVVAVSEFSPILASEGTTGVYARLALVAPSGPVRDRALARLWALGAGTSGMYPSALDRVNGLKERLVDPTDVSGAQELAARLLTLPTHGRLRTGMLAEVLEALQDTAGRRHGSS